MSLSTLFMGTNSNTPGMNPYRIDTGWPQEVRGKALLTVAEISVHKPDVVASRARLLSRSASAILAVATTVDASQSDDYSLSSCCGALNGTPILRLVASMRDHPWKATRKGRLCRS